MKTGGASSLNPYAASSLNPYAASYVPLFKRGVADVNKEFSLGQEFYDGNVNAYPQGQHQNVPQIYPQNQTVEVEHHKWEDHRSSEFVASTSQYPKEVPEKPKLAEEFDMDLAYLQMIFPGISEESLSDVYLANRCDLDYAVDMLNQLETQPDDDSSDKLPDTLDIGDVPEAKNERAGASTSASAKS